MLLVLVLCAGLGGDGWMDERASETDEQLQQWCASACEGVASGGSSPASECKARERRGEVCGRGTARDGDVSAEQWCASACEGVASGRCGRGGFGGWVTDRRHAWLAERIFGVRIAALRDGATCKGGRTPCGVRSYRSELRMCIPAVCAGARVRMPPKRAPCGIRRRCPSVSSND